MRTRTEFPPAKLQSLSAALRAENFEPYITSVGGSGLGILSPYDHGLSPPAPARLYTGPVTPPETPSERAEGGTLREQFSCVDEGKIKAWAEGQGRWLFV